MVKYESNMVLATKKYKVIGTRPIRHDGTDKVTGAAKYGADFKPARLLHGATLRSPHAHARIKSIDTSAAEAMPGVEAVLTGAQIAEFVNPMPIGTALYIAITLVSTYMFLSGMSRKSRSDIT